LLFSPENGASLSLTLRHISDALFEGFRFRIQHTTSDFDGSEYYGLVDEDIFKENSKFAEFQHLPMKLFTDKEIAFFKVLVYNFFNFKLSLLFVSNRLKN
jgi:hypothetical protein